MDILTRSKNHGNDDILNLWEVKEKYEFPVNLNITTGLLGCPIFQFRVKKTSRPIEPQIGYFPNFPIIRLMSWSHVGLKDQRKKKG